MHNLGRRVLSADLLRIRGVHSIPSPFQLSSRVRGVAFRNAEAPEPSGIERKGSKICGIQENEL